MAISTSTITTRRSLLSLFPADYQQAREEFLSTAEAAGCSTASWPLQVRGYHNETLAIDVARWGSASTAHWLLITSGLHGTEGPFGTAVQLGFLRQLAEQQNQAVGILFLHGLNPYGYSWIRRSNENNVDLNRNFLLPGESFQGSHPLYRHVYETFEPHRRERFSTNFYLRAWWLIVKHSRAALQTSLPIGQYDYPKGLFFGGQKPEQTQDILYQQLRDWMPAATEITHLDFHTGLGRWADFRLLIDVDDSHEDARWLRSWAPPHAVESIATNRTAYQARGTFGPWLKHVLFPHAHYRYTAAEFGTYSAVRVLHSLVREMQTHYAYGPNHHRYRRAKHIVQETFVPRSRYWRTHATRRGIDLCHQSWHALTHHQ